VTRVVRTADPERDGRTLIDRPVFAACPMEYDALLQELYRLERFGIKLGLDVITELLERLGNPHRGLRSVHVTGTNGKGSVCAFVDSVLREAGYRVGLYTSPHLVRFNERIRVDGQEIPDADVARLYARIRPVAEAMAGKNRVKQPTFFEVTTAMAFLYFVERNVDIGVIEVGMGGGMDATNVVQPLVAVITRIGLEHTEHLGKTEERIAREKSGIIKPGCRVVTIDQPVLPVIEARAHGLGCTVTVVGREVRYARRSFDLRGQTLSVSNGESRELRIPLLGTYQPENAAVAYAAIRQLADAGLSIHADAIDRGFARTAWPGRLQIARHSPTVVVDGTHNAPAVRALAASLRELFPGTRITFVVGILNDKDLSAFADHLGPLAGRVIATRPQSPRAYDPDEIVAAFAEKSPPGESIPAVSDAIDRALAGAKAEDVIVVTGSIYTAGEALAHLEGRTG